MSNENSSPNGNGSTLESAVKNCLVNDKGFTFMTYPKWVKDGKPTEKILIGSMPYTTVYGTNGKTEFCIVDGERHIRIECKWQQASGSVDEKYPYLYLNCMVKMPEKEIIILLDGGGYKKEAREWLQKACASSDWMPKLAPEAKSIKVFNMSDFIIWANKQWKHNYKNKKS